MKGSANSLLISKVEFTINRPLKEVAHTFLNFFFNTEYNSNFSQIRIYTIEECHDETNFLAHGIYKIPVPFQDRDLCASVKLINVDEETALIVFENNDFMPLQKSYIRSYTGMSGFLFKKVRVDSQTNRSASPTTPPPSPPIFQRKLISLRSSRNGSEKNSPSSSSSVINPPSPKLSTGNSSSNLSTFVTQVTHVFHLDLCGGIPKWVINSLTSKNLMSCLNIKNQFEMETFPLNSKKLEFYSLKDVQNEGK